MGLSENSRIPGSIRKENPVRIQSQGLVGRCVRGNNHHPHPMRAEKSQDITFHPEIVEDDQRLLGRGVRTNRTEGKTLLTLRVPFINLLGGNLPHQINFLKARRRLGEGDRRRLVTPIAADAGAHGSLRSEMPGESPSINPTDRRDSMFSQIGGKIFLGPPVTLQA